MANFGKIKSIEIVIQPGTKKYAIGDEIEIGRFIGSIEDKSIEYPECIEFIYQVFDTDGDLIASIENCSVDVMYEKPSKES